MAKEIIFLFCVIALLAWWIPVYLGVLTPRTTWSQLFSRKYWFDQIKAERVRKQKAKFYYRTGMKWEEFAKLDPLEQARLKRIGFKVTDVGSDAETIKKE